MNYLRFMAQNGRGGRQQFAAQPRRRKIRKLWAVTASVLALHHTLQLPVAHAAGSGHLTTDTKAPSKPYLPFAPQDAYSTGF